jgi:hypothetical protein
MDDTLSQREFQARYTAAVKHLAPEDLAVVAGMSEPDLRQWVNASPASRPAILERLRPKPHVYRITCPSCRGISLLDIFETDAEERYWTNAYRRCPHCDAQITIPSSSIRNDAALALKHGDSSIPNPLYLRKPGDGSPRPSEGTMFQTPAATRQRAESDPPGTSVWGCVVMIVVILFLVYFVYTYSGCAGCPNGPH